MKGCARGRRRLVNGSPRLRPPQGDVRRYEDCERMAAAAAKHTGQLDILVNCAAGNFLSPAEQLSSNGFRCAPPRSTSRAPASACLAASPRPCPPRRCCRQPASAMAAPSCGRLLSLHGTAEAVTRLRSASPPPASLACPPACPRRTVLEIDTLGTFHMCRAAFEPLKQAGGSGGAVIINISMTLHYGATWWQAHASAAKVRLLGAPQRPTRTPCCVGGRLLPGSAPTPGKRAPWWLMLVLAAATAPPLRCVRSPACPAPLRHKAAPRLCRAPCAPRPSPARLADCCADGQRLQL